MTASHTGTHSAAHRASHAAALRAFLLPDLRATRTLPLIGTGTTGLLVAGSPAVFSAHVEPAAAALLLRVAAVLGGLGLAFVLDDPAARTTSVAPLPGWLRRGARMAAGLLAFGLLWGTAAAAARLGVNTQSRQLLPLGGLAVEAAALAVVTLALALLGLRLSATGTGSSAAAPGLAIVVVALLLLPEGAAFFTDPGAPGWDASMSRWWGLLAVATTACAALLRDPGRAAGKARRP